MKKLSLKRLQPNWPSLEFLPMYIEYVSERSIESQYKPPSLSVLKSFWLKGLPVRRELIRVILREDLSGYLRELKTLDLMEYLRMNNRMIHNHPSYLPTIIHIAFNMIGLGYQCEGRGGVLFDFVKIGQELNIESYQGKSVLVLKETVLDRLSALLDNIHDDPDLFWSYAISYYHELTYCHLFYEFSRTHTDRFLSFPAKKSGFCPMSNRQLEDLEDFSRPMMVALDSFGGANTVSPTFAQGIGRPWRPSSSSPRSNGLDEKTRECIRILNEENVSEETKFYVYELILASNNDGI